MAKLTGQVVLVVNGLPIIHLKSVDGDTVTNRELVVGMSPTGQAVGFVDGTKEHSLSLECYVPKTGDVPWEDITGATIGIAPRDGGTPMTLYTGVFVEKVGVSYQEKGAAMRKIEAKALFKVEI